MTKPQSDELQFLFDTIQKHLSIFVAEQSSKLSEKEIEVDSKILKIDDLRTRALATIQTISTNLDILKKKNQEKILTIRSKYENKTTQPG